MASSINWILSVKAILISTGVVSVAVVMKLSVPLFMNFAVYEVPVIWSTMLSWLKPPYLYVIINAIIITIAVSSRFHQKLHDSNHSETLVQAKAPPPDFASVSAQPEFSFANLPVVDEKQSDLPSVSVQPEFGFADLPVVYEKPSDLSSVVDLPVVHEESEAPIVDVKPVVVNGSAIVGDEDEDEFLISRSTWTPPLTINSAETQTEYLLPRREKPLVSTRFGHRRPVKASPEGGRALRVAKPKRQETLENTWKTITDGRHMPLTRHLKQSDTWENHSRQLSIDQSTQNAMKSETFNDRTAYDPQASSVNSSPGSRKLRKEPSLSQDELNRRVEAFINKFNEEMRLQRQESLNQYLEMINRGAH